MTRFQQANQLPDETLRWLEQRLRTLEKQQRFECAYALRMEVADWLLKDLNANLAVPFRLAD